LKVLQKNKISKEIPRFFSAGGAALDAVKLALGDASLCRIATAYFEPTGWKCLKDTLKGKGVRLLLGRPDTADDKINEVVDDFFMSLNSGTFDDRIKIMEELRDAISNGLFLVNISGEDYNQTTLGPRYIYHHAKLYIGDLKSAVVTSANFTHHGLVTSREAGIIVTALDDVLYFAERFDYYFDKAVPIAALLLERIEEWLKIYRPYDIYMLSLITLYGLPSDEKPGKLPPLAGYQRPVVSRVIRNIEEYGGSMLVASTGLGKTIMAAHIVAHLRGQNKINAAIVLCPSGLKSMWQRTMRAARVSSVEFSYYIMSVDDWRRIRDVSILEREIKHADSETIIILDESHHLRNSEDGDDFRLRHRRIMQMVGKEAKILLMTATPYSKNVGDINSQLMLLPHCESAESLFGEQRHENWKVERPAELSELKCGVVLTAPCVVKHFSSTDENSNRYVVFSGNEKRFFPHRIVINNIGYKNPIDDNLLELLKSKLLYVREKQSDELQNTLFNDFDAGIRRPLFESHLVHRFCSSLAEADAVLEKMTDEYGFEKLRFERADELGKKADEARFHIKQFMSYENDYCKDDKINAVVDIIKKFETEKIVIFCVYKATADYIVKSVEKYLPGIKIKSTVDKNADELETIIQSFAPVANSIDLIDDTDERPVQADINNIRILVATTAMSEGFNFQDASIMINFDLPWTVLVLAQRMGRILRPWKTPRDIHIFTLMPSTMDHPGINHALNWNRRLHQRNKDFSSFAEIPVIVEKSEEFEMFDLAKTMNQFENVELNLDDVYKFIENADNLHTSSFIDDLAVLSDDNVKEFKRLPDGVKSYKRSRLSFDALYMLVRFKNSYYPAIFNDNGDLVLDHDKIDEIMKHIRSTEDEESPVRFSDTIKLDKWYNKAIRNWALEKRVSIEDVSIRCMMVLNK
jgi:superfamily II DNA or RNA helicase